jgi:hypothetical protein
VSLRAYKTFSGLLAAYVNGYNGRHAIATETEEIAAKPCQTLYSVFS